MTLHPQLINNPDFKLVNDRYPHIGDIVNLHWSFDSFNEVTDKLIMDTRGGTRQGFPDGIGPALLRLIALHAEQFPVDDKWVNMYTPTSLHRPLLNTYTRKDNEN